jgi:hypothetical protein
LTGKWTIKENLGTARYSHTATLLASGKVLIVAGQGPGFGYISSAELYDPSAATWTNTGSLSVAHNDHTATLLNNGFVLVTGGDGGNGAVASAELYNPEIGTWTSTGNLATARFTHTATLMPSGQVLVAGGYNSISGYLDSSELYDSTTVTSITGPSAPLMLGGAATVTANFVDLGNQDTNTCSIAWGDGTSSAGAVSEVNGSGTCTGYHQYTATGVYEVTFTITDNYKATGTGVFQFVVMYDPSGGFVTGGGWINSPAGAYQANPSLTGRANFGFVSKYQHGATVPTGNTEFNFSVASFDFQSSVYEWMVISGGKARYRGTGSVNGSGGYGFELTAWDGQVNGGGGSDKFRIKIWDQNQGNAVVYDNQMGAPDGTDPTMVLGGGSIVIHQ